jgi:hypothetical protein
VAALLVAALAALLHLLLRLCLLLAKLLLLLLLLLLPPCLCLLLNRAHPLGPDAGVVGAAVGLREACCAGVQVVGRVVPVVERQVAAIQACVRA